VFAGEFTDGRTDSESAGWFFRPFRTEAALPPGAGADEAALVLLGYV
jgi:hypothetical protein